MQTKWQNRHISSERLNSFTNFVNWLAANRKALQTNKFVDCALSTTAFYIPSEKLASEIFKSREGAEILKQSGIVTADRYFDLYRRYLPHALAVMYSELKRSDSMDERTQVLSGMFAQAVFENGDMPHNEGHSTQKLMKRVGEQDRGQFDRIKRIVAQAAIREVFTLASQEGRSIDELVATSSSADMLNDLLREMPDGYAFEVLNALELGGYDLDSKQILRDLGELLQPA